MDKISLTSCSCSNVVFWPSEDFWAFSTQPRRVLANDLESSGAWQLGQVLLGSLQSTRRVGGHNTRCAIAYRRSQRSVWFSWLKMWWVLPGGQLGWNNWSLTKYECNNLGFYSKLKSWGVDSSISRDRQIEQWLWGVSNSIHKKRRAECLDCC